MLRKNSVCKCIKIGYAQILFTVRGLAIKILLFIYMEKDLPTLASQPPSRVKHPCCNMVYPPPNVVEKKICHLGVLKNEPKNSTNNAQLQQS